MSRQYKPPLLAPCPFMGLFRNVLCWSAGSQRTIYTKTYRSIMARVPNPPSAHAAPPVRLSDGSLFVALKTHAPSTASCPIVPSRVGRVMTVAEAEEARAKHAASAKKRTIQQLCKRYNVSRSYVLHNLLSPEERDAERAREQQRIDKLNTTGKRGLLMRRMIQQDRFRSW